MTLQEILEQASREHWAVPHFNISNFVQLKGIVEAARELSAPVMIGTSEGEAKFIGFVTARAMINAMREETHLPIFLNADHFHSFETSKAAIDAGYDSVAIDLSKLSFEENVSGVQQVIAYARTSGKHVHIEGELGYIVTDSSKIYKETVAIPKESLTKPEEAVQYINETNIDRFAAAVGSLHGIAANAPVLDFDRIKKLREVIPKYVALVLHGGSGIADEDFVRAIQFGINNIHISTNLRVAYVEALRKALKENPDETTPYKLYPEVIDAVKEKTKEKIRLFGADNKG